MSANADALDAEVIADQLALQHFSQQPVEDRTLTAALKGVLAETACSGVIRYDWPLLRDLVTHQLEAQLREYEAAEHVDVGPARSLETGDVDVAAIIKRFTAMLNQFQGPPWTLQRLCELLLEPKKQYQRLHKLVLALEKLLLVTGEVELTQSPPPPPRLSQLSRVNDPPPAAATANAAGLAGQKRSRPEDAEASGLVTAALTITGKPGQQQAATAAGDSAAAGDPTTTAPESAPENDNKENNSSQPPAADAEAPSDGPNAAPRPVLQEAQQHAATTDIAAPAAEGGAAAAMDTEPSPAAADGQPLAAATTAANALPAEHAAADPAAQGA